MKLEKKIVLISLISLFFIASCAEGNRVGNEEAFMSESVGASQNYGAPEYSEPGYDGYSKTGDNEEIIADYPNSSQNTNGLNDQMVLDRKLIKNASISFETDTLSNRKNIVDRAVKQFNAYVEHEEQYTSYDRESVVATIRVPSSSFDQFMEAITNGVGSYDSKAIEVADVTEEFVDVEARIHTKKELKIRFIALLDKAKTIAKIMEIEREITALQAEIESYEGRLKYLSASVRYATINITYYQMLEVPMEFENKFESAFSNGWNGMVWFFVGLVSVWPFLIIIILTLFILKYKLRKRKSA